LSRAAWAGVIAADITERVVLRHERIAPFGNQPVGEIGYFVVQFEDIVAQVFVRFRLETLKRVMQVFDISEALALEAAAIGRPIRPRSAFPKAPDRRRTVRRIYAPMFRSRHRRGYR